MRSEPMFIVVSQGLPTSHANAVTASPERASVCQGGRFDIEAEKPGELG